MPWVKGLKGLSSEMEWGMKLVSIGLPLRQRNIFFYIKGSVYNLQLKISAPKQHLPNQGAWFLSECRVFFNLRTRKLKSFATFNLLEREKIYFETIPLCNIHLKWWIQYKKSFYTIPLSKLSKFPNHHIFSKPITFQARRPWIYWFFCFFTWNLLGLAKIGEGIKVSVIFPSTLTAKPLRLESQMLFRFWDL